MADARVSVIDRKPTEPGLTMTGMAVLRAGVTGRPASVALRWFDVADVEIGESGGDLAVDDTDGNFYRIVAAAPAGAVWCTLVASWFDMVGGEAHYVDTAGIFPGDVALWSPGGFTLDSPRLYVERRFLSVDGDPVTDWEAVRGNTREAGLEPDDPSLPAAIIVDHEVPPQRRVEYRAFVVLDEVASDASSTEEALLVGPQWRLRDALDDSIGNIALRARPGWAPSTKVVAGVFYAEGRDEAIVATGQVFGISSSLVVWALSEDERDAVMALLTSKRTLLLQSHLGEQWYVRVVGDIPQPLLRLAAELDEPYATRHAHEISAPVVQVAKP